MCEKLWSYRKEVRGVRSHLWHAGFIQTVHFLKEKPTLIWWLYTQQPTQSILSLYTWTDTANLSTLQLSHVTPGNSRSHNHWSATVIFNIVVSHFQPNHQSHMQQANGNADPAGSKLAQGWFIVRIKSHLCSNVQRMRMPEQNICLMSPIKRAQLFQSSPSLLHFSHSCSVCTTFFLKDGRLRLSHEKSATGCSPCYTLKILSNNSPTSF